MSILRTAEADEDLIEIWGYIGARNEVAADKLLDRLEQRWNALTEHPHLGRNCDDLAAGVRCLVEGDYLIFYRLDGRDVVILRVLHGRRAIGGEDFSD